MPDIAPDPTTNTLPTDPGTSPPDNWDFLDTPDDTMPGDPPDSFDEEDGEEVEAKTDAVQPTAEAVETPEAAVETETAPVIPADIQSKADQYDAIDKAFQEDPLAVVRTLLEGMDARQRAEFAAAFGGTPPDFNLEEYEPQGEMEQALKSRWGDIAAIPELVKQTKGVSDSLKATEERFIPHISQANVQAESALAMVEAICEALEIEIAAPDLSVVEKELKAGRSYRDAVRAATDFKKVIETAKQSRTPRPRTPGNGTRRPDPIPEGTDMVTIARRLGTLPRR
jgi:hypothetical protein